MGIGGSTSSRPTTPTVSMDPDRSQSSVTIRSQRIISSPKSLQEGHIHRPTGSGISQYKGNHAGLRTVTPVVEANSSRDSIDDEIEEIVANTLDLVSNQRTTLQQTADLRDTDRGGGVSPAMLEASSNSSARSRKSQRRLIRSGSMKVLHKRAGEETDFQFDAKEALPEVDFAKFKKVNHQGATIQKNGRIIHHQESDLLWRLGLISPEAYKINTGSRSAPSNQGPYMKTPSYDLTEEQLMANIEKEFECIT